MEISPSQLLVIGKGNEQQPEDNCARLAATACRYAIQHSPEIKRIVWSGGFSCLIPEAERVGTSEAITLDHVARTRHTLPQHIKTIIEERPTTLYQHFYWGSDALDSKQPFLVVTGDHPLSVREIGSFVLPTFDFEVLHVPLSAASVADDEVSRMLTEALTRVHPGNHLDIQTAEQRALQAIQQNREYAAV